MLMVYWARKHDRCRGRPLGRPTTPINRNRGVVGAALYNAYLLSTKTNQNDKNILISCKTNTLQYWQIVV